MDFAKKILHESKFLAVVWVHPGNILVMVGSKIVSFLAVAVEDYSGGRGPGIILHNKQVLNIKIYY